MRVLTFVLFLFVVAWPDPAGAAPKANLWPDWQKHDPDSTRVIDHSAWQDVLDRYLIEIAPGATAFDYARAKAEAHDRIAAYVRDMEAVAVSTLNRDQQFAYWVNLYNALTVQVVLDHYPVASIRDIDISPGLFSSGPWGKKLLTIEGRSLGLDDIEHRILRPIWRDPRIHYAVNCASIGCPALAAEAYQADRLEAQLDAAARGFVNHPRAVQVNDDGSVVLSSLYDWYRDDFGKSDTDFIAHLARYAGPELMRRLTALGDDLDIADYQYDWALNDARRGS